MPSVKTYLYGSGAAAILIAGIWLGRKSASPRGALGFSTGISSVDYAFAMPKMSLLAGAQVARAMAGSWLTDQRKAENYSTFLQTPTTNVAAYYTAAYWMAVAARLIQSRSLALQAHARAGQGGATFVLPFSSQITGSVVSILTNAAATIRSAAGGSKTAEAVARVLADMATPTEQASAKQTEADKAWVSGGAAQTAKDIVQLPVKAVEALAGPANWIRAMLGLLDPNGAAYPWWMRWGSRLAVGGIALLGARWYFAPQYNAARAAWGAARAQKEVKQIEDKAA